MRIPKAIAALAAVSLALGASLVAGLTATADTLAAWTVDSLTSPLLPDGTLEFSGTRPAGDVVDSVTVAAFGEGEVPADCIGLDVGNTLWSCSYTPPTDFPVGDGTITFYQGAVSSQLTFTVNDYPPPPIASGPPTMSYGFYPAGVTAYGEPVSPATKVAIGFYEFLPLEVDQFEVAGGCPVPNSADEELNGIFAGVALGTGSCSLSDLLPGIWNIYSQQDIGDGQTGTGDFADDYFVVPNTPIIGGAWENWDHTVTLEGTADVGVDVVVLDNGSIITCPPDFSASDWTCQTDVLASGSHDFTAYAVDNGSGESPAVPDSRYIAGGQSALSGTAHVSVNMTRPSVEYTQVPGGFVVDSTPVGDATVARTDLYLTTVDNYAWVGSCGGPTPDQSEGYYWDGDRFAGIDPGQENYGCSFLGLAPGLYSIESQQDDGTGAPASDSTYDSFVISETPVIDDWYSNGGEGSGEGSGDSITVYGTATPGYLVHVVDADLQDVCEPVVADEAGDWSCVPDILTPDIYVLSAYSEDIGAGEDTIPYYYWDGNYAAGGLSALSDSIVVSIGMPLIPEMSYEFVPGGIVIDGVPTGNATVIHTDFYSWDITNGFRVVDNCGGPVSDSGGEGEPSDPFFGIPPGATHCVFTDLTPGIWNPYSEQDTGDGVTPQGDWADDYFVVPTTPAIAAATVHSDGSITLTGTTASGNSVHVLNGSLQIVCDSAPADTVGGWTCTTPALPNGLYNLRAYAQDLGTGEDAAVPGSAYLQGGLSNLSAVKAVTVVIAPSPDTGGTPPGIPVPTLLTPTWFFTLGGLDFSNMHPGDTFTISGNGLPAGATISAELHSTPVILGQATVASNGAFALSATVPENTESGAHTIVVTLTGAGLAPTTRDQAVTVSAIGSVDGSAGSASGSGGPTAEAPQGETTDAHGSTDPTGIAPNILTNSMNPIVEVLNDPGRIPAAFAAGLVLIIFAIVPAHLLNSTVAEQYERLTRRLPSLKTTPRWYTAVTRAFAKAPVLGGIALMVATGFLFAFADPTFGLNLHSLRLIIALSGALFVVFFIANAITGAVMRRVWNVDVVVKLRPVGLLLTVAGVIVSRILDFSPGFLIGIVLGLSIATTAAAHHAWKAVLIRASVIVGFGIASWVVYSSIADGVHQDPTFLNEVVLEFFVAIATEGIVLLLVELLPLHMLEGERLFKRSRALWAVVYLVVLTMFILAVVPWAGNWRELGESFWPWFTAVALFGAACVAVYLYFRFIAPPLHGDHATELEEEEGENERIALGNDR